MTVSTTMPPPTQVPHAQPQWFSFCIKGHIMLLLKNCIFCSESSSLSRQSCLLLIVRSQIKCCLQLCQNTTSVPLPLLLNTPLNLLYYNIEFLNRSFWRALSYHYSTLEQNRDLIKFFLTNSYSLNISSYLEIF